MNSLTARTQTDTFLSSIHWPAGVQTQQLAGRNRAVPSNIPNEWLELAQDDTDYPVQNIAWTFDRTFDLATFDLASVVTFMPLKRPADFVRTHNAPARFAPQMDVTAGPAPLLGKQDLAALEAHQQADAIVQSRDLRAALASLIDDEGFSPYDLHVALGVGRSNVATWRTRPVEKLRAANAERLWRLLYVWKLWLGIGDGQPLGPYLRVTATEGMTLLDILDRQGVSEVELNALVDDLAKRARDAATAKLHRRRYLAGLPGLSHGSSEFS